MSDNILRMIDPTEHTYFKMLAMKPYLRLKERELCNLIYASSEFSDAAINMYPAMVNDPNDITKGYYFIAFDIHKIKNCVEEYKALIKHPNVRGSVHSTNKDVVILTLKVKDEHQYIFDAYLKGDYTQMFTPKELFSIFKIFLRPTGVGIPMRFRGRTETFDSSFHILLYSPEYEMARAADLGVSYEDFKGTTHQAMSPTSIGEETLDIEQLLRFHKLNMNYD